MGFGLHKEVKLAESVSTGEYPIRMCLFSKFLPRLVDSAVHFVYRTRYIVQETVMLIRIEPSNGLAIYDQVVRQIKFAVSDGALREGELAPSVRELARELPVGHVLKMAKVRAVARDIEGEDVAFELEDGRGCVVHLTWRVEADPLWPHCEFIADLPVAESD